MNVDDLIYKLNDITINPKQWKNTFNSCKTHVVKENYTKDEVIQLLNDYEDELMIKFMHYIRTINTNIQQIESNKYIGPVH